MEKNQTSHQTKKTKKITFWIKNKMNKEYYKMQIKYTNKEGNPNKKKCKIFGLHGVYNFGGLELSAYGWTNPHPPGDEGEMVALVGEDGKSKYKKEENLHRTSTFKGAGTIVIEQNIEEEYHEITIFPKEDVEDKPKFYEETQFMLEKELKCKLEPPKETSNLVKKINSN